MVLEVLPPSDETLRHVKPMARLFCKHWGQLGVPNRYEGRRGMMGEEREDSSQCGDATLTLIAAADAATRIRFSRRGASKRFQRNLRVLLAVEAQVSESVTHKLPQQVVRKKHPYC